MKFTICLVSAFAQHHLGRHRSYQQHHCRGRISEPTQPEDVSCSGSQQSNTKALRCLAFKSVTTTALKIIIRRMVHQSLPKYVWSFWGEIKARLRESALGLASVYRLSRQNTPRSRANSKSPRKGEATQGRHCMTSQNCFGQFETVAWNFAQLAI